MAVPVGSYKFYLFRGKRKRIYHVAAIATEIVKVFPRSISLVEAHMARRFLESTGEIKKAPGIGMRYVPDVLLTVKWIKFVLNEVLYQLSLAPRLIGSEIQDKTVLESEMKLSTLTFHNCTNINWLDRVIKSIWAYFHKDFFQQVRNELDIEDEDDLHVEGQVINRVIEYAGEVTQCDTPLFELVISRVFYGEPSIAYDMKARIFDSGDDWIKLDVYSAGIKGKWKEYAGKILRMELLEVK